MNRLLELLLGLDSGFLQRQGDVSMRFDPRWPLAESVGHATWNVVMIVLIAVVVWLGYRVRAGAGARFGAGASAGAGVADGVGKFKISNLGLAILRGTFLLLLLVLLNRPSLTLTTSRIEPSVLAILVDDSLSMAISDAGTAEIPKSRFDAAVDLLNTGEQSLIKQLARTHDIKLYRFSRAAEPIDLASLSSIKATGLSTNLVDALESVSRDFRGQRLAGALVLTDGRETSGAAKNRTTVELARQARQDGLPKLFAVRLGQTSGLSNVQIEQAIAEDAVFQGDIVNVRVRVRANGLSPEQPVTARLTDELGQPVRDIDGRPVEKTIRFPTDATQEVDLQFIPTEIGQRTLRVTLDPVAGEVDPRDNQRELRLDVVDSSIAVLLIDGYPRWEFRYLRQELIRDRTVEVSTLLTSSDSDFAQDGDRPISRFPLTIDELKDYDVVVIGDVDPRQFTDGQLQLIEEFVGKLGGGFGMIAGPRSAPQAYRSTSIELLLPVDVSRVAGASSGAVRPGRAGNAGAAGQPGNSQAVISEGFRPVLTPAGREGGIFRFFPDSQVNDEYIKDTIQPLFWFCRDVTAKPGVGQVLAQHPTSTGPDGKPSPLVVVGRYGAGRTFFSGLDETWRWRFYTGEGQFNSFWVQSLRYLARGRKLGQRKLAFSIDRPSYQLGEQVRLSVRVPDGELSRQLPGELRVQVADESGRALREVVLTRLLDEPDRFTGSFPADQAGVLQAVLPAVGDSDMIRQAIEVGVPRVEFETPEADEAALTALAQATGGRVIEAKDANTIPSVITSAKKIIPQQQSRLLWGAPIVFLLLVGLLLSEWIGRKKAGLI